MVNTPSSESKAAKSRKAAVRKRGSAGSRRAAAPVSERRRATPAEQLATEMLSVKEALDGVVAQFGVRVSGQLAEVLRALQGPEPPSKRTLKDMIVKVQDVKLRPERGRIKDLLRLQALADDLVELLAKD
ncbi:MAG: hypothetical protein B7Z68_01485 [Acidobacteria bacterium 21-70-11]|nr:MAG: hypothetical protein B7Z68_01485 [Acidobacteria bacterium 21-70-11]HQT93971.1 hypothetical protein [Thermoanaerobaculaceae bacterium]